MFEELQRISPDKIAGYIHWQTDVLPQKTLKTEKDADKVWKAVMLLRAELDFSNFYVDAIDTDYKNRALTRLYEDCKSGKIECIVFPSLQSLRFNIVELYRELTPFLELEHPPIIYFALEDISSTQCDFKDNLSWLMYAQDYSTHYNKRKRKLRELMKY